MNTFNFMLISAGRGTSFYRYYYLKNARYKKRCLRSYYLMTALENNHKIYFFKNLKEIRDFISLKKGVAIRCSSQRPYDIDWNELQKDYYK